MRAVEREVLESFPTVTPPTPEPTGSHRAGKSPCLCFQMLPVIVPYDCHLAVTMSFKSRSCHPMESAALNVYDCLWSNGSHTNSGSVTAFWQVCLEVRQSHSPRMTAQGRVLTMYVMCLQAVAMIVLQQGPSWGMCRHLRLRNRCGGRSRRTAASRCPRSGG